ncbi:uncharacterized protein TNCV_2576871 [Trichonephila clavipes]|nr:uncharacterized protein TNCV_2576871 [Trichonephila clavipes]
MSPDYARSVAFSQRANSLRLIKMFNDCGIINNLIDYVDGQEEPDSLTADIIYAVYSFPTNWESLFIKIDTNSERSMKFQKELRSRISDYRDIYKTATAGSDVVQSGRPIFDDFFQHLWPYIGNNTANVVFQMVKRLWLIHIDH